MFGRGKRRCQIEFADGVKYNGKIDGKGKYTYANGNEDDGDWAEDKRHMVTANIFIPAGEFKNDKKNGNGKMMSTSGTV
ncbi:hypothetical protein ACHAXR_005914 [Thalassiosira sp. AJA248-18]